MLILRRPFYRTRQVWHALRPRIQRDDLSLAAQLLTERESLLFYAMEKRDQRHALEVTRRLMTAGVVDHDLLAAALLHDCGKGAVPVWLRIMKVLAPPFVRSTGLKGVSGWRGAAYRLAHHPEIGAQKAEDAGSSPATVRLIAGHVIAGEETNLLLLQSADDAS
jgi:hypothetical protein